MQIIKLDPENHGNLTDWKSISGPNGFTDVLCFHMAFLSAGLLVVSNGGDVPANWVLKEQSRIFKWPGHWWGLHTCFFLGQNLAFRKYLQSLALDFSGTYRLSSSELCSCLSSSNTSGGVLLWLSLTSRQVSGHFSEIPMAKFRELWHNFLHPSSREYGSLTLDIAKTFFFQYRHSCKILIEKMFLLKMRDFIISHKQCLISFSFQV